MEGTRTASSYDLPACLCLQLFQSCLSYCSGLKHLAARMLLQVPKCETPSPAQILRSNEAREPASEALEKQSYDLLQTSVKREWRWSPALPPPAEEVAK